MTCSLHPTMTCERADEIARALGEPVALHKRPVAREEDNEGDENGGQAGQDMADSLGDRMMREPTRPAWEWAKLYKQERTAREESQAENTRLRAALAMSDQPCAYCALPADEWSKCKRGFPGCARADDSMGCPHLGASLEAERLTGEVATERAKIAELELTLGGAEAMAANELKAREAAERERDELRGQLAQSKRREERAAAEAISLFREYIEKHGATPDVAEAKTLLDFSDANAEF